jgi:hypothetical protein
MSENVFTFSFKKRMWNDNKLGKITSQSMITVTIITTKLKIIINIKGCVVMFACSSTEVSDLSIPSEVFIKFVFLYDTL